MELLKRHIPTALTLFRIPCAIGFLYAHKSDLPFIAIGWFVIGCMTDYFDGLLARKWQVTSDFGKVADAYCDKILCWTMTFVVVSLYGFNAVTTAVIVVQAAYDGGLTILRYMLGQVNIPVNTYAKWKTTFLMIGFIGLYIGWIVATSLIVIVAYIVLLTAISFAIMSIATYLRGYNLGWLIPYPLSLIL